MMQRTVTWLALGAWVSALMSLSALAQTAPEVTLTRLDGGTPQAPIDVNTRFSDTYAYNGLKLQFVYSCYLIKHGDDYMVWDTGFGKGAGAQAPNTNQVNVRCIVFVPNLSRRSSSNACCIRYTALVNRRV